MVCIVLDFSESISEICENRASHRNWHMNYRIGCDDTLTFKQWALFETVEDFTVQCKFITTYSKTFKCN